MRNASNAVVGANAWNRLALGAGGWCTGIDVADDGTWVTRTDTCGGYFRSPTARSATEMLRVGFSITEANMTYGYPQLHGAYDVAIAATNSAHMLICQEGYIYRSANSGVTFTKTTLAYNSNYQPNVANRMCGRKLAYDPAGTNVIVFGDPTAGARYSLDSGTTWTLISTASIPAPTGSPGFLSIAFDRNSTIVSGKTQIVYIYSSGNGIYRSTTGIDGTFTLIASSPTSVGEMVVSRAGVLMTCGSSVTAVDTQFRTWTSGGGWLAPSGILCDSIASNTTTATTVYIFGEGGSRRASTDTGVNFTTIAGTVTKTCSDYPWMAWTLEDFMSNGNTVWDPNSGRILFAMGIGVFEYVSPSTTQGAALVWNSVSRGIEQLVVQQIDVTPTGRVLVSVQDRAFFSFPQAKVGLAPSTHGPNRLASINHGSSMDYCIDNSAVIYGVHLRQGVGSYSTDSGITWTSFAALPANVVADVIYCGNIAAGNVGNAVWLPTGNAYPSYTTNGGTSWTACNFGATQAAMQSGIAGLHHAYSFCRRCMIADKNNPGIYYFYVSGDGSASANDLAVKGLWKSTDSGANFTKIYNASIVTSASFDIYNGKLRIPTGYATDLFWTCGDVGSYDAVITAGNFKMSHDSGVTWNAITTIDEVIDFAFGMAAPGASYPTIYAFGYVSSVRGVYRCCDFNPSTRAGTWVKIGDYPDGHFNTNNTLAADMTKFGRVYMGYAGSGAHYADYTDAAAGT